MHVTQQETDVDATKENANVISFVLIHIKFTLLQTLYPSEH